MPGTTIKPLDFSSDLVKTNIHGLVQDLYVVNEEKIISFYSISLEAQIGIAFSTTFLGLGIGTGLSYSAAEKYRIIFWVSTVVFILSLVYSIVKVLKYHKVQTSLFARAKDFEGGVGLQIKKATYGANDSFIDVTLQVKQKIADNKVHMDVNNEIAGDPIQGVSKKLMVDYLYNGVVMQKTFNEGETIDIP